MKGLLVSYSVNGLRYVGPVLDVLHFPVSGGGRVVDSRGQGSVSAGLVSMVLVPVDGVDAYGGALSVERDTVGLVAAWLPLGDVRIVGECKVGNTGDRRVSVWDDTGELRG